MKRVLRAFSMKMGFEFRTEKSDSSRYVLHCIDRSCSWMMRATAAIGSTSFVVKTFVSEHTCDSSFRNVNHRQASARALGSMVSNHFEPGKQPLKPKQLIEKFRFDHGIVVPYIKAWRASEYASLIARGSPAASYEILPKWFHMIKLKNPGSVTFIEVDADNKFKYAFLAFGASIRGFQLMRKVISVDGAFLKSKFRGTLLGASAQDGNFQLYPIAFGIVDSENDASWEWFMRCLLSIVPDSADLVFVSDRAPSIANALSINYPSAHHGICSFHFQKNLETRFRCSNLIPVIAEASRLYSKEEFDKVFSEISQADQKIWDYLVKADIQKWSRAYSPVNRFNIMTSNLAESLNAMLKESREYPILCLLETIRTVMTKWFFERRGKSSHHQHPITLNVGQKMVQAFNSFSRWYEVCPISHLEFEVKGDKQNHIVSLGSRKCTCQAFNMNKYPCPHAIAACKEMDFNENDFVDDYYSTQRWALAYSESIHPCGDSSLWEIPPEIESFVCLPPSTRIPSGRPKKKKNSFCLGAWEIEIS